MALPLLQFSNNAQTTLAGSLTSTATTAQLATGTGAEFPALATGQGFYGSLFDALTGKVTEIVLVTAIATDTLTIVRAQDNTTARAWASGDTFALYPVAADMNAMAQQSQISGSGYQYALDSGSVNAYATVFTPSVAALANNMTRQFLVKTTNTGASTLAIDGLTASPLVGLAGTALTGGELVANGIASVTYSVPAASWVLTECLPASSTVAAPTQVAGAVGPKHAVQLQQVGHGQCRVSYSSATAILLKPYNGNNLVINGVPQPIPLAGVTLANTGLAASTPYLIYAYMNAGTMALEASTTAHITGANGVEIKTGDVTRTLVGSCYTTASSQFVDAVNLRHVLNWFNRRVIAVAQTTTPSQGFSNTTYGELNVAARLSFLSWADEAIYVSYSGVFSNTTANNGTSLQAYLDNAPIGSQSGGASSAASLPQSYSTVGANFLVEGQHIASIWGNVAGGTTTVTIWGSVLTRG